METRRLGKSDLEVSAVGVGCNNFGRRIHDIAQARAVVHRALDLGIALFDTADVYGSGKSEEFLGEILGARRRQVVIATKFGMGSPGGASRRSVTQAVEASLRRLRTDWIDLYQVHCPDTRTPIEETMQALDGLVRHGKVRQVGCSNFSAAQVDAALGAAKRLGLASFVTCQDELSLLVRGIERSLLPAMQRHGLSLLPYAPLASGFLTGKYRRGAPLPKGARLAVSSHHAGEIVNARNWEILDRIDALSGRSGYSVLELAFGWLLAKPVTASVIAGASTPEQIERNVAAGARALPQAIVAELDRIAG